MRPTPSVESPRNAFALQHQNENMKHPLDICKAFDNVYML